VTRHDLGQRAGARVTAVLLACLVVGGCADYSGTPSQRVQEWVRQNSVVADNNTVASDIARVNEAVKRGSVKLVNTICAGLGYDVGTAYTTLPAPDQALTNAFNAADTVLLSAANSCADVSSVSAATMATDTKELHTGVLDLRNAQGILRSLGVTWKTHL
jgi:hypothetical protein